jgi:DNA replication and repair protein RecF
MRVTACTLRDFRCYEKVRVVLGEGVTVVAGPNGAGKTNLLEGIYFGCTARSCRTNNERELVRFGVCSARVEISAQGEDGAHELSVGLAPGEPKRMRVDGAPVERLLDVEARPLISVFLPDRLELIKGPPVLRRAHVDQLVAALWPTRVATRRAYMQVVAQRNALIARIRAGLAARDQLHIWDAQLSRVGIALMADRGAAAAVIAERFSALGLQLGLDGELELAYRPRSRADDADGLAAELAERVDSDLDRGFTTHGPHRDELALRRDGRDLRTYGSQGEQRVALLALLLAEREALAEQRGARPLLLLDDVMSELDPERRRALIEHLQASGGQVVITTADLEHVPGARDAGVARIAVAAGRILQEAAAA